MVDNLYHKTMDIKIHFNQTSGLSSKNENWNSGNPHENTNTQWLLCGISTYTHLGGSLMTTT